MVQAMRQAQTRSSHGWDDLGCINKPLDQDGRTSERTMWNSSCLKMWGALRLRSHSLDLRGSKDSAS
eukprot:scaffold1821_cov344-Pavlova_lutheri.AAC.24